MAIYSSLLESLSRRISESRHASSGFALPTILIVSTIMLIVLMTAMQSSASVNESISSQYTSKLGRTAADAGLAMAKHCFVANNSVITWSSASPLKPNTNCSGTDLFSCPTNSTSAGCYVMTSTGYRTKFRVGVANSGTAPIVRVISSQGIAEEVRKTNGLPVNRTTFEMKAVAYPPPGVFTIY